MNPLFEFLEGFFEERVLAKFGVFGEELLGMFACDGDKPRIGQVFHGDIGEAALAGAKESAWTAELEVDLGEIETTRVFFQCLESPRLGTFAVTGEEKTVTLVWTPTDSSAELVKLRETEAFGSFDEHDGGIGNVDPDFDDGCRDEDIELPGFERLHDRILFLGFLPAMEEADAEIGEDFVLEPCVLGGGGSDCFHRFAGLDQREDDEGLATARYFLVDKIVNFVALGIGRRDSGDDRLLVGGDFIEEREIEIAKEGEGERARDRGGSHAQKVRDMFGGPVGTFKGELLEFGSLRDTKAMLLIDHDQSEPIEAHLVFEECVGADNDIGDAGLDSLDESGPFERIAIEFTDATRKEGDILALAGEEFGQGRRVLDGEDLGRGEERSLVAGRSSRMGSDSRDDGLAASDIAIEEPVHGVGLPEISENFCDSLRLALGQLERKRLGESFDGCRLTDDRDSAPGGRCMLE